MEQKKDISTYKTKDMTVKNQDITAVHNGGNFVQKDNSNDMPNNNTYIEQNNDVYDFDDFVNNKTKKLTTALYMVTSFLSDSEPLKWKMRERSVALLIGISNVRYESVSEVDNVFTEYVIKIDEIMSLLEVAVTATLVSEMNFSILKKEYSALREEINSSDNMECKAGRFIFKSDFFEDSNSLQQNSQKDLSKNKPVYIEEKKDKLTPIVDNQKTTKTPTSFNKRQSLVQGQTHIKDKRTPVANIDSNKTVNTKLNRREIILKLFKNKKGKELSVKDISYEVSDCSEKTVQRELVSLVASGVLKKRGERRWSKYSLK